MSLAQYKAQRKYDKDNTKQIALKLNINTDADILAKLAACPNKQGYIKELIRQDMRQNSEVLSVETIKQLLMPIVNKFSSIYSLSIFGPYAKGEAEEGDDVDILIDLDEDQEYAEYMDMIDEMEASLGRSINLVTVSSLEESTGDQELLDSIESSKIVLFEY